MTTTTPRHKTRIAGTPDRSRFMRLLDHPETFHRLTGLTPDQFHTLVTEIEPLFWEDDAKRRAQRQNRKRKTGAGKRLSLTVAEMLFMLLLYYRTYITHVFLGFLMDVEDSNVWMYFARMEPVLTRVFKIPERKINLHEDEVWELIVDATEQRSNRAKGAGYSGKKKGHTMKSQVIASRKRRIVSVSKPTPGQRSDKKLYDRTKAYATTESLKQHKKANPPPRLADLGYVGIPGAVLPEKKKRKKKGEPKDTLTKEQKSWNKLLGKNRVVVEHVFSFSGIKKFMIIRGQYRIPIHRYAVTFKNIAGLHNFVLDNPAG